MRSVTAPGLPARRRLLLAVLVTGLALAPPLTTGAGELEAAHNRPNFVVVMTDDQRADDFKRMRSVRTKIAERGTTFANAFATFPLCCPSRATFLTGQYAHNHGVRSNTAPEGGWQTFIPKEDETIAMALSGAGYRTGFIGKYLNGWPAIAINDPVGTIPPGWSSWQAALHQRMFDWRLDVDGRVVHFGEDREDYQTDVYARRAKRFIHQSADDSSPFFLVVSTLAPHVENGVTRKRNPRPAPRHRGTFDALPFPIRPAFNEADTSDKPSFIPDAPLDEVDVDRIERRHRDRLNSLLAVDDLVGTVTEALRDAGEARKTFVIYTSDNGYLEGEHRVRKKTLLYEESVRVPLMMRGPGVPRGVERDQIAANIDVAPTILEAADVSPLAPVDGIDLVGLAQDPGTGDGRSILLDNPVSNAVRDPNFMYAEHSSDPDNPGPEEFELYDLATDPLQLENLYEASLSDPELEDIREGLEDRLDELVGCVGAGCR
jgi:N-acetylglucosamine-6-sulfatase